MSSTPIAVTRPRAEPDLIERHRLGDPGAFEEIYARHEKMVFNLALRMSGSRDEAAELTQEVFLRVYRGLTRFRGRSSLKTWIFRISLNCCRSRLGRRKPPFRDPGPDPDETLERVADPRPGPERDALNQDLGARLAAALAQLPLVFREAVVLRDVQGFSYAEIAEILRIRTGTVRSRIARGRERLRRVLENES